MKTTRYRRFTNKHRYAGNGVVRLVVVLLLVSGCSGSSDSGSDPLYALSGWIRDSHTGKFDPWLTLVPEITNDLVIDPAAAFSPATDGRYHQFVMPGDGTVLLQKKDTAELFRYSIQDDTSLVRAGTLHFADYGVSTFGRHHPLFFLSESKAYWVDIDWGQIVVWNPQRFEIESRVQLDGFARDDSYLLRITVAAMVENRLVLVGQVVNPQGALTTMAAFVDTENDTVVYDSDNRCVPINSHVITPEGDLMLGAHATIAALTYGNEGSVPPCQLRIAAGRSEFDRDYLLNTRDLFATDRVVGPLQGAGDQVYYIEYDAYEPAGVNDVHPPPRKWTMYSATLGQEQATLAPVGYTDFLDNVYEVTRLEQPDGRHLPLLVTTELYSDHTQFVDISDPENFRPFVTVPGIFARLGLAKR